MKRNGEKLVFVCKKISTNLKMRQIQASFSQDIKSSSKQMRSNFGSSKEAKISR